MDWSTITSSKQLTEEVMAQAVCTRESVDALLDQIGKFNEPFKIEAKLVRFFVLLANQEWVSGRLTVEIAFPDVTGRGAHVCKIRLLLPSGDKSMVVLKQILVHARPKAFRDILHDRRKLSPFMLEDGHKDKFILITARPMSLPPPGGPEALTKKFEARLAKAGIKFRSMPPEMRQGLAAMKGEPSHSDPDKVPAKIAPPRPTPVRIPAQKPLPADLVDIDQSWDEDEGPTLRKPRK